MDDFTDSLLAFGDWRDGGIICLRLDNKEGRGYFEGSRVGRMLQGHQNKMIDPCATCAMLSWVHKVLDVVPGTEASSELQKKEWQKREFAGRFT